MHCMQWRSPGCSIWMRTILPLSRRLHQSRTPVGGRRSAQASPLFVFPEPFCFELVDSVLIMKAEFFEPGGNRAGIQHCGEMCLHGGKNLRPVCHHAEHVGHVAARGKSLVIKAGDIGRHLVRSRREIRDIAPPFWFLLMVPFRTFWQRFQNGAMTRPAARAGLLTGTQGLLT